MKKNIRGALVNLGSGLVLMVTGEISNNHFNLYRAALWQPILGIHNLASKLLPETKQIIEAKIIQGQYEYATGHEVIGVAA